MKSTDMARRDRELRRSRKKIDVIQRQLEKKSEPTVGDYINKFHSAFFCDEEKIYNIKDNVDMLVMIEEMQKQIPEKEWDNVLRKAIRKTQVKQKDQAFTELKELMSS